LLQLLLVGTLLPSFPTREYFDLTHCDCPLLLKQDRTFPLTLFSTYTMEKIWQLAHGVQQRCCPLYRWQRNTARITPLPQLFRRYQCAQEHQCFYALTTLSLLFLDTNEAIPVRTSRTAIRTTTLFFPTHFHSFKQPIPRVLSALIMMALTRIYAPLLLCLFILAHCLDPHHGDNKTDIDQSVLACSHAFNVHSSTPHSPLRC